MWPRFGSRLSVFILLCSAATALTQSPPPGPNPTNNAVPVVTIFATDPFATWSGDPGVFTVFRRGDPSPSLNIYYRILGTASNGVDYATIGNFVQIPSGVYSNTIVITPTTKGQNATKTVTLVLSPSPLMPPVNYIIGNPSNATVLITGSLPTNVPPVVRLVSPTNGATFYAPVDLPLMAFASDRDGFVTGVEFFAGTNSLGVVTNGPVVDPAGPNIPPPGTRAFFLTWSNVPPGAYVLTAVATDDGGASTASSPVNIMVKPGPPPPPTNQPPIVRITSPANHTTFRAPVDIPLIAYGRDPDGFVNTVEFFANGSSLGFGRGLRVTAGAAIDGPTNLFVLVWSNAPPGTNIALTAQATDNDGASTVSDPVLISVLPPLPPPTNRPPVVTIVATDPVAIEGTNCWPWVGTTNVTPAWSNWPPPAAVCRLFTNCGPKNATFAVRRVGATNDALTIPYAIGGSASNGVDYVTLPGVVTIPAGERAALITVVPIDDGPPDFPSTVILKLKPPPSAPPNYVLGYPSAAAALILDGPGPRPITGLLPDRCFHLRANGPDGAWFRVEYSTDLLNWTAICTNQVILGGIDFVDPDAAAGGDRFYRAVPELGPPQ